MKLYFKRNKDAGDDRFSAKKAGTISRWIIMGIVFFMGFSSMQIPGTSNCGSNYKSVMGGNAVIVKESDKGEIRDGETINESVAETVKEDKVAYITFDDGPSERTEEVLDILKENNVRATFFMIGNQITKSTKNTVRRVCAEGHQIGVHTYCHEAGEIYRSADSYYKDVLKTEKRIIKYTGEVPTFYRFPWGSVNGYIKGFRKELIEKLSDTGMRYCDWNVSGEDSIGSPSAKQIIANIKQNYNRYNQPVILLHDAGARRETVKALPHIIKLYRDAGYGFDIIKNREKPFQWNVAE